MAHINLSKEDKNYIRLQLLSYKIGTEVVRDFLGRAHSPLRDANIAAELGVKRGVAIALRRQGRINGNQWRLLYPLRGAVVDANTFDLTLMILLLRNFGNLGEPVSFKWDELPSSTDIASYHDLARIKFYRNKLAHLSSCINDADFTTDWKDLSDAILRLAHHAATRHVDVREKMNFLKCFPFNQDDLVESLKDIQDICNELSAYMMGLEDKLDEINDGLCNKTQEQTEEILECINANAENIKDVIDARAENVKDAILHDLQIKKEETTIQIERAVADLKITSEEDKQQILESVTSMSQSSQQQLNQQTENLKQYFDKKLQGCETDQIPSMTRGQDEGFLEAFARELKKSYQEKYVTVPFVQAGSTPRMFDVVSNLYMPVDLTPLDIRCSEIAEGGVGSSITTGAKDTSEIITLLGPETNPKKLPILVEADAGVGKTTLFHRMALDWVRGSETTQKFKLVILIPLRRVKSKSLVDIICHDLKLLPSDLKEELKKCLFMHKPDILILLDGLDEVTLSEDCELVKLMREKDGHLMCSSRPLLDDENQKYFYFGHCWRIKLLGFSDNTLAKYIQKYFENKEDIDSTGIADKIMAESRKHLFCKAIIKIPLYAGLFCYLWEKQTGTFPHTATQVFNRFLIEVLNTYFIKYINTSQDAFIFDKSPFEETVPVHGRRLLKAVAELAYTTMMKKKIVFSASDIRMFDLKLDEITQIGLFTVEDEGDVIFFRHKMFHEYFAGLHLTVHPELVYTLFAKCKKEIIERSHLLQNAFFFAAGFSDDTYQRMVFALNQKECMSFKMENRSPIDVDTKCTHCSSVVCSIANPDLPKGKAKSLDKKEDSLHLLIFFIQLLFEHNNFHDHQDIKSSLATIPIHCSSSHSLAAIFHVLGFNSKDTITDHQDSNAERIPTDSDQSKSIVLIDGPTSESEEIIGILKECSEIEDVKYLTLYKAGKQMIDEILGISWQYVRRIGFQECDFVVQISTLLRSFPHLSMMLCDEKSFQNGISTDNSNNSDDSVTRDSNAETFSIRYAAQTGSPLYAKLKSVEPCRTLKAMLDKFGKRYVDVYQETSYLVYNRLLVNESTQLYGSKSLHPQMLKVGICFHSHQAESDAIETVYEYEKGLRCQHFSSNESFSTRDVFCRNGTLHIHNPSKERLQVAMKYYKTRRDVNRLCLKNTEEESLQAITKTDWQYVQLRECPALDTSSFIRRLPLLKNIFSDQWIQQYEVDGSRKQEDIHLWVVQENIHCKCDDDMSHYYSSCRVCKNKTTGGTMTLAVPPGSFHIMPQHTTAPPTTQFAGKEVRSVCLYGGLPFHNLGKRHIEAFICKLSGVEYLHVPFTVSVSAITQFCRKNPNLQSVIIDLREVSDQTRWIVEAMLEMFKMNGTPMVYTLIGIESLVRVVFTRQG